MMPKRVQSPLIFVFLFLCSVAIYAEVILFTVIGQVTWADRLALGSGLQVVVTNQTKPLNPERTKTNAMGKYQVAFVDLEGGLVAAEGDQLLVELKGEGEEELVASQSQTITLDEISNGFAVINLPMAEKPESEVSDSDEEVDEVKVPGTNPQPRPQLTGDVNGDSTVNIFDLVIAAGSFGKTGVGIMGDVNGDDAVNIFDLVIVAGNFGKSLVAAAPSMVSKVKLTTEKKHHIASAIDQLESNANLSSTEEIALNVLKTILPERLPTQTQLLANYPNPFNPETWIPFQLAQDSIVTAKIYDVTGKQIRIIELGYVQAGNYVESSKAIYWDGRTEDEEQVSSGTYFYQIEAGDYTETRKMVILK